MSLIKISDSISWLVRGLGFMAGVFLLLLISVTLFDTVSRRFFVVGSTFLQEMEWHLNTIIFSFAIGYAYIEGVHIRIDIMRENFSLRKRAIVEIAGILVFLIPYCILIIYHGINFSQASYQIGEGSSSGIGLPQRWIIKSVLSLGMFVLLLSGVAILLRAIATLRSKKDYLTSRSLQD